MAFGRFKKKGTKAMDVSDSAGPADFTRIKDRAFRKTIAKILGNFRVPATCIKERTRKFFIVGDPFTVLVPGSKEFVIEQPNLAKSKKIERRVNRVVLDHKVSALEAVLEAEIVSESGDSWLQDPEINLIFGVFRGVAYSIDGQHRYLALQRLREKHKGLRIEVNMTFHVVDSLEDLYLKYMFMNGCGPEDVHQHAERFQFKHVLDLFETEVFASFADPVRRTDSNSAAHRPHFNVTAFRRHIERDAFKPVSDALDALEIDYGDPQARSDALVAALARVNAKYVRKRTANAKNLRFWLEHKGSSKTDDRACLDKLAASRNPRFVLGMFGSNWARLTQDLIQALEHAAAVSADPEDPEDPDYEDAGGDSGAESDTESI